MSERLSLVLVLLAMLAQGCGGSAPPSSTAFETQVVLARDRVDFALERITKAESLNVFLKRMDEAAEGIADAAGDLDRGGAPDGLESELDDLVVSLEQLAFDVQSTADQIRQPGFDELLSGARGLSFTSWEEVDRALAALRSKGVEVAALERHGGP